MSLKHIDEKLLLEALKQAPVRLAYLFGSQAKGTATASSDIDLAVLQEEGSKLRIQELQVLLEDASGIKNLDVRQISLSTEPLFLKQVLCEGKPLYIIDELERIDFETKALQKVYDARRLEEINQYYLDKSFEEESFGS